MFGVGWAELLAGGVLSAAVFVGLRWGTTSQWLQVDEHWRVAVPPSGVEGPLRRMLEALPSSRLRPLVAGSWLVTVTRTPLWVILPLLVLFPLGLLFLLFEEHADAEVLLTSLDGGAEIRLVGTTRASVRATLAEALAGLPGLPH